VHRQVRGAILVAVSASNGSSFHIGCCHSLLRQTALALSAINIFAELWNAKSRFSGTTMRLLITFERLILT
jgi:hypothetical protein